MLALTQHSAAAGQRPPIRLTPLVSGMRTLTELAALAALATLVGCGTTAPSRTSSLPPGGNVGSVGSPNGPITTDPALPVLPAAKSGRGGYYKDDGPGESPPPNLWQTPDAAPKLEPLSKAASRPYAVFGKTYTPITDERAFRQRGIGSWYGKKFHGLRTSSGERYDMYKMTAAHPTLPIPSYARVTSIESGKSVVVRINDRGPFHANRIVDLSYTAALKLGLLGKGSHEVEIERILPDEIARMQRQTPRAEPPRTEPGASDLSPALVVVQAVSPAPAPARAAVPVSASAPEDFSAPSAASAASAAPAAPATSDAIGQLALNLTRSNTLDSLAPANRVAQAVTHTLPDATPGAVQPIKAGFYLQLGAYSQSENAESVRVSLRGKWQALWPLPQVVQAGNLYRLFSGPFETRDQAFDVAQQMQNDGLGRVLVVQR